MNLKPGNLLVGVANARDAQRLVGMRQKIDVAIKQEKIDKQDISNKEPMKPKIVPHHQHKKQMRNKNNKAEEDSESQEEEEFGLKSLLDDSDDEDFDQELEDDLEITDDNGEIIFKDFRRVGLYIKAESEGALESILAMIDSYLKKQAVDRPDRRNALEILGTGEIIDSNEVWR